MTYGDCTLIRLRLYMDEKSRGRSQVAIANAALIGHRIGRAWHDRQAWITHPLSPLNEVQLGYLLQPVQQASKKFIGGGRSVDYSARTESMLSPRFALSAFVRYEHWKFPILSTKAQNNTTALVQIVLYPNWSIRK